MASGSLTIWLLFLGKMTGLGLTPRLHRGWYRLFLRTRICKLLPPLQINKPTRDAFKGDSSKKDGFLASFFCRGLLCACVRVCSFDPNPNPASIAPTSVLSQNRGTNQKRAWFPFGVSR